MNVSVPPALPVEPERPASGFFIRLAGVLFSPRETFEEIVRRPAVMGPLALLLASALAMSTVIYYRIGPEQILRTQLENNPRMQDMPSERREEMVDRMVPFVRYSLFIGPLLATPIILAGIAALLLGMANFVFGAQARYSPMFSATAWSYIPGVVSALLGAFILFFKDPADVDVQNVVAANLSLLFDAREHPVLHRLGMSLDLFSLWQIALLSLGVAAVSRLRRSSALAAVLIPWGLWVLGAAGWKAIWS